MSVSVSRRGSLMPTTSAPESSLSISDSHCNWVTMVVNLSPQFYTWVASSPIACISKEVLSQFLKLWALFFTSARICSCHRISCFHSYKNLRFGAQAAPADTKWGARPPAQGLGGAGTWAQITTERTTEACSTGITLSPQCCRISKTKFGIF